MATKDSPNLKNYTSTVSAQSSQSKIEKVLIQAGASHIARQYGPDKVCKAIRYTLPIDGQQPLTFEVEANVQACYNILIKGRTNRTTETQRKALLAQAERTAWKIISEWVEIQVSMSLMDQAKPLQLMLAFLWNEKDQQTFYDHLQKTQFKALLPPGQ